MINMNVRRFYTVTPAYITPPRVKKSYKISWIRMILMGLMLFGLITVCLYLYHTAFREYNTYLTEAEKKSTAWIVKQLSFMLPFIAVAAFQCAVYAKHDNRDGVLQRERAYEILIAAALTYLVLLPLVWWYSDAKLTLSLMAELDVPKTEGKTYETLMLLLAEWFARLTIPLCLLFVYHMARAKAEVTEAEENAAIEAQKAAETAAEAATETATDAVTETVTETVTEDTAAETVDVPEATAEEISKE